MPVYPCGKTGKWRIGKGPCIYKSKKDATKAWIAIRIKEEEEKKGKASDEDK